MIRMLDRKAKCENLIDSDIIHMVMVKVKVKVKFKVKIKVKVVEHSIQLKVEFPSNNNPSN